MDNSKYEHKLDKEFRKSKNINFFPFIGKKYLEATPKIMVLGESHYIDPNIPDEDITEEQLKEWDNDNYYSRSVFLDDYFPEIREDGTHPNKWVRCYRNTSAVITGKGYHVSDYIWETLSFYNFFQNSVGKGAKGKEYINSDAIERARQAYFEVIDILKPELIIVWGIGKLFYEWVPQEDRRFINENFLLYKYNKLPETAIWHIPHPSQGFSYEWYHSEFLQVVKELGMDISKFIELKQKKENSMTKNYWRIGIKYIDFSMFEKGYPYVFGDGVAESNYLDYLANVNIGDIIVAGGIEKISAIGEVIARPVYLFPADDNRDWSYNDYGIDKANDKEMQASFEPLEQDYNDIVCIKTQWYNIDCSNLRMPRQTFGGIRNLNDLGKEYIAEIINEHHKNHKKQRINIQKNNPLLNFTAIDFETATGYRNSVCQVGLVKVVNGVIIDEYCGLIQPPRCLTENVTEKSKCLI